LVPGGGGDTAAFSLFGAMMLDARAMSGNPIHASGALLCSLLFTGEAVAEKADFVRVDKSERRMELLAKDVVLRTYHIALGASPLGHKQQQGDERNPKSAFTTSIHVSYPNDADQERAREAGVPPGGDIMIHGQPRDLAGGPGFSRCSTGQTAVSRSPMRK
jgi:murein L,D-transpeptidase YafK